MAAAVTPCPLSPLGHGAQTVRQRAELPRGRARRSAPGLAQPHRGGDVHLVHVETGRTGTRHVHVIGAQGVAVAVDSGVTHQLPSMMAEAGERAGCRKHPPPGGVRFAARPRPQSRVRFGARCPARNVSLTTGKGVVSRHRKELRRLCSLPPLEDATTGVGTETLRLRADTSFAFHDVGVRGAPIMKV